MQTVFNRVCRLRLVLRSFDVLRNFDETKKSDPTLLLIFMTVSVSLFTYCQSLVVLVMQFSMRWLNWEEFRVLLKKI